MITTIVTCDFQMSDGTVCGAPAPLVVRGSIATRRYVMMATCREHGPAVDRKLIELGFTIAVVSDSKVRQGYITASGEPFSARQAREWALSKGLEVPRRGRLGETVLNTYAAEH